MWVRSSMWSAHSFEVDKRSGVGRAAPVSHDQCELDERETKPLNIWVARNTSIEHFPEVKKKELTSIPGSRRYRCKSHRALLWPNAYRYMSNSD